MRRIGPRSSGAAETACARHDEGRAGMTDRDVVTEVPFLPPALCGETIQAAPMSRTTTVEAPQSMAAWIEAVESAPGANPQQSA